MRLIKEGFHGITKKEIAFYCLESVGVFCMCLLGYAVTVAVFCW